MATESFDLVVLGAGPGGYVAAIRASQLGMKTAIVEKENLGGVCLNWGCIPSKALLRNAELLNTINHEARSLGFSFEKFEADYAVAFKRSRVAALKNSKGVEFLMKKNNIKVFMGEGRFTKSGELAVFDADGKETAKLKAKNTIIATGGRARPLPGVEFDGDRIMQYRDSIMLEALPKSIIIVGAGAIGVEFGYVMNAYGTEVTIVEMLPRALPLVDAELSAVLTKSFKKRKIEILTSTAVKKVAKSKKGVKVTVEKDGKESVLEAEKALVSIGFMPSSDNIGLAEIGVETEKGWIKVDENFKTSREGVYAIGDVIGEPLLAHAASAEALECVERLAGEKTYGYNKLRVPNAIYCQPQIASVGLTEEQAQERGYDFKIGRFPFSANGKARAMGEIEGLVKLIVDKKYGEILGAHIAGHDATEQIIELTLAMNLEVTPLELHKTIHPHPTLSEAVAEAAADALGHAIHI
ncbi:MAG TPA: dihydrolipoyl dehydrogenase [Acidobacteriota bacterium]|nr:dihydrolipoyl dehydrogenase [Acidobacteriota bacterium]